METVSNFPVDPPADLDAADVAKLGLNLPPSPAADVGFSWRSVDLHKLRRCCSGIHFTL